MKRILLLPFLLFALLSTNAMYCQNKSVSTVFKEQIKNQYKQIDSLLEVIRITKSDTIKIRLYHMVCDKCLEKDNLKYCPPMLALCDKVIKENKDSLVIKYAKQEKAIALRFMAMAYEFEAQEPLDLGKQCLKIYEELGDLKGIVDMKVYIANWYANQGNFAKQLEYLQEGLVSSKKIDDKRGMARFLRQMQMLYANQGDTLQAIKYIEKGIKLEREIGDSTRLARGYFLTGEIYARLLRYDMAIESFLKAISMYKDSKNYEAIPEIQLKIGDAYTSKKEYEAAILYLNMASESSRKNKDARIMFFSLLSLGTAYQQQGNNAKAIELHQIALHEAESIGMEPPIAMACKLLARDYLSIKDFVKAKKYSDRALGNIHELVTNTISYDALVTAYQIDSASGNYKSAFEHFQQALRLKELLNSDEVDKAASREKFQDELEKQKLMLQAEQEKKDVLNEEEKAKQRIIIYSVSVGLVLVLLLVVFVYRSYMQKQKANTELAIKNETIQQQKHLVEEKHKEITDSINYAERIQRSFMATKEMLDGQLKNYFVFFKPKDIVSGDFYWAAKLNNGRFAFVTADSTGHGVPGAIMSLLNIASLEKSIEKETEPAEILNSTRRIIIDRLKKDGSTEGGKDGMDCNILSFDKHKSNVIFSGANNPVWIVRSVTSSADEGGVSRSDAGSSRYEQSSTRTDSKYKLIELEPDKMPVGKHDKDAQSFTQYELPLQGGDVIYSLTDGFPDQFGGPKGKKFMYKKLKDLLISIASKPMHEQEQILKRTLSDWQGSVEQVDDITIIGIRV